MGEEYTPVSLSFVHNLKICFGNGLELGTSEDDGVLCLLERVGFASLGDMEDFAVSTVTLFTYLEMP
jgi:hypothetical protein